MRAIDDGRSTSDDKTTFGLPVVVFEQKTPGGSIYPRFSIASEELV